MSIRLNEQRCFYDFRKFLDFLLFSSNCQKTKNLQNTLPGPPLGTEKPKKKHWGYCKNAFVPLSRPFRQPIEQKQKVCHVASCWSPCEAPRGVKNTTKKKHYFFRPLWRPQNLVFRLRSPQQLLTFGSSFSERFPVAAKTMLRAANVYCKTRKISKYPPLGSISDSFLVNCGSMWMQFWTPGRFCLQRCVLDAFVCNNKLKCAMINYSTLDEIINTL